MSKPAQSERKDDQPATLAVCAEGTLPGKAQGLAARLALPLVPVGSEEYDLLLVVTPQRLELRTIHPAGPGPVYVDFVGGPMGYAMRSGGSRLLFNAIGFAGGSPSVVDATAGLGRDAYLLAVKGARVTALERSPVVAALLQDGLDRALAVPQLHAERLALQVIVGDARHYLESLTPADAPDVVYLDPMFPPRKKSAEVKKEMRVLRRVVGDDPDAAELFEAARRVARRHVVVKRMKLAPPLAPEPTRTYTGESTRYDLYAAIG